MALPVPDTPRPASARTYVFEQLRNWIEEGVLEPGQVIKDSEIAERLGVSRTPVREALQMLEGLQAVETTRSRFTRVTSPSASDGARVRPVLAALHGAAAALAAAHMDADRLAELRAANADLRHAVEAEDPGGALAADVRFHDAIVAAAGNPFVDAALEPVTLSWRRITGLYFGHRGPSRASADQHERIIAALEAGDAVRARACMEANILAVPGDED